MRAKIRIATTEKYFPGVLNFDTREKLGLKLVKDCIFCLICKALHE